MKTIQERAITIACIVVATIVIAVVGYLYVGFSVAAEESRLARKALKIQKDTTGECFGYPIKVNFNSGELINTAVASSSWGYVEHHDVNKSRVAGNWVGEKTKEAAKGFFGGLFEKSKHSQ